MKENGGEEKVGYATHMERREILTGFGGET
jgi:hypothetical protein